MVQGWKQWFIIAVILSAQAYANDTGEIRNQRYCEIIAWKGKLTFAAYSTIGLNDCPDKQWKQLTKEGIEKQLNSSFVYLNGPRYWVLDKIIHAALINPQIISFNGLEMREAGVLHVSFLDLIRPHKPYRQRTVDRNTTCVYADRKPVYELIDPTGQIYVMQSYSVQKAVQTIGDLSTLGNRLHLPKGWRFCTGTLQKTTELVAIDHKAFVVQDDFWNTYQLQSDPTFKGLVSGCTS